MKSLMRSTTSTTSLKLAYESPQWTSHVPQWYEVRHISGGADGALVAKTFARNQLDQFEQMEVGWDGDRAEKISLSILAHARAAVAQLIDATAAPELVPNVNGTISMEWETDKGYAHLEIGARNFTFLLKPTPAGASIGMKAAIPPTYGYLGHLVGRVLYDAREDYATTKVNFSQQDGGYLSTNVRHPA